MSICEIVRARAAAHSSVLRMALDDVGRALLRVGTVARNTRLLRRSYRVFRRVSRVGVLLVPRRACDGWASSIISYRMSHTIVHGIRAQHTRRRYRVAYPISELFRTLPPLRCTSPSESLSYRMLHTIVRYRMLYRMSHTNLHGIRAQHAWRRNRVTYPIPKRSSLSDLRRYSLSEALVRASTCALVARWLEQHSSRMLSDALWMRVVRYCERSKPNDSAQSVSVLSVR